MSYVRTIHLAGLLFVLALIAVAVGGLFDGELSGLSAATRSPQLQPLSLQAREAILKSLAHASTSSEALVSFDQKQVILGSLSATGLTDSGSVTAASGGAPNSSDAEAAMRVDIVSTLNNE